MIATQPSATVVITPNHTFAAREAFGYSGARGGSSLMRARHQASITVLLLALSSTVGPVRPAAQQETQASTAAFFSTMRWRSIGPARGGRSIASAGVVGRPNEYYFGAVGGGLWKTVDGGTTWNPVTDGQVRSSSVGAVAVSESNPDIVYIGMGEACLRGNIMQGDGIYKSTDAGKTWKNVGLADSQVIARLRVHPTNPELVYAAVFGHPAAPHDTRGVYRSKDGGQTWQRVLFRDNKTGAIDLAIDRQNPNVLYAALWEAYRVAWQMSSGGPGSGLFKSTDGGNTWTELTRNPGMPGGLIGRIGVAVSGADSNRVFAIVENDHGGVFRSDDAGATWEKVNDERNLRQRAFYYTHITADPKNRDTVYVLNTGFYKSTDGGKKYTTLRPPHGDNHDLWIDPTNPDRMVNSNDGGGNVSVNGGRTWTDQDFATAQFYHVATTKDFPYHVCGAQQDNSTACVPSAAPRGRGGAPLYTVGGGESGYIAPHPKDPDIFYAGSQGALVTRFNRRTGQIRDVQVYPRFFSGEPSSALKERWQWTFPIVFSPNDASILYVTSQHVWRTTNEGQSWERVSPDLTRADPKTLGPSGGPITGDMNGPEIYATVFALAPSKIDANLIWAGSDDGLVQVTRDGGRNWENVTPKDLPEFPRVSTIDASPNDAATAYVAAKRYQLDDRAPYIYRTHDSGRTWQKIVTGIRPDDYVHVVREDPARRGLLYAGTEHGLYISFDDGDHWQSLSLNLPDTQIADLVVEGHDLVAATHGRSFWILDDITPLREFRPEIATTEAHLFKPADAVRSGGPAAIYYYLKSPAQKVTVDVLDSKGQIVRTYSATREEEEKAAKEREAAGQTGAEEEGGFGRPERRQALTNAGLTKFTWDLRYTNHTTFPGMILWSGANQGPAAVPGSYQVRINADGKAFTQSFGVQKNPLYADVSQSDLEAQFALAMQVRDKTSEANQAVIRIREIKKQADERVEKAGTRGARLKPQADALKARLGEVEEEIYQVRNQSGQDPLNFPIRLNNRLAALRRTVETGDARPTDSSYVVFKELSAELDVQLSRLSDIERVDLPAFNKRLVAAKLDPIHVNAKVGTN
jgi:photosystem II stability/assembly factor-like uncharacterized protein